VSARRPYWTTLPGAVSFPLSRVGLAWIAAAAAAQALLSALGAGLFAQVVPYAFYFRIVRHTAAGRDVFPVPGDFRGFFADVVRPVLRLAAATVWAWAPALAWLLHRRELEDLVRGRAADANPDGLLAAVLFLAGGMLAPTGILAASLETPLVRLLDPRVVAAPALRLGRDYALACGFWVLGGLASAGAQDLLHALFGPLALPGLGFARSAAALLFGFIQFRALGLLVRAHGDELRYGPADDSLALVPDEAVSSGKAGSGEAALALESYAIPLPDPGPDASAAHALVEALRASDPSEAVAVFERCTADIPALTLSAQAWVGLGNDCLARNKAQLAVAAFQGALDVAPEGPLAPTALLLAARTFDERLRDPGASDRLLRELVRRYPESAEGRFAASRLSAKARA
jgi:tetratricopeptide (TPR) repeat protein